MKKEALSKIVNVAFNILLGTVCFTYSRIFANSFWIPGLSRIAVTLIRLAVFTFLNYTCIRILAGISGLKMSDCYVTRPAVTRTGVMTGILFPVAVIFILTRLPGTMVVRQIPKSYALAVLIPTAIDWGLGSGINEELLFRGFLLKNTEKNFGRKAAVLITSLVFGSLHLLNEPLSVPDAVLRLVYTTSMGILLCVLTLKSKSIWSGALVHGLANVSEIIVSLGFDHSFDSPFVYLYSYELPWWLADGTYAAPAVNILAAWICIALLCLFPGKGKHKGGEWKTERSKEK